MSVESKPSPTEIQRAILDALSNGPLHYTILRRALRAQWARLPTHSLDDVLDELLKQEQVELVRNGQCVSYQVNENKRRTARALALPQRSQRLSRNKS